MASLTDPETALEAKKRGNAHFKAQRWEEGIAEFTEAIRLDPTQHVFFSNRSACYAGQREFEKALDDANQVIKIKPDWPKGYSRKGLAEYSLGRYEDSVETYKEGLKIAPENAPLKEGLSQAENSLKNQNDPMKKAFGPDMWTKLATNPQTAPLLQDQAVVQKLQLLQTNPQQYLSAFLQDPKMQQVLGVIFGLPFSTAPGGPGREAESMDTSDDTPEIGTDKKPEPKKAKSEPEPIPEPEPEVPNEEKQGEKAEAEKALGNAAYKAKQFDQAVQHYTKAIELDPKSPVYLLNRSAVYFMLLKYDECVEDCNEAIQVGRANYADMKWNAKAYSRMGEVALKRNNTEEAIAHFNNSLLEENSRKVRVKLKKIQIEKDEADRLAYLDDEKALIHKDKGNEHFKASQWVEAIKEYSESLKRNPNDHKVYCNRAGAYSKLMSWAEALRDCEKAIKLDSTFAKSYLRKGKIQHLTKEFQKAIVTYDQGISLASDGQQQLVDAKRDTLKAINQQSMSGEIDPEQRRRAMADPEVQNILRDPTIQKVLEQIQSNPAAASAAFADPEIKRKLEVLIAAGIISMR